MIKLYPFAISELLVAATFLPMALYIFAKGKTPLTKVFSLFLFAIFIWGIGGFILTFVSNKELALTIFKLAAAPVFLIPALFYHSILLLTKKRTKFLLTVFYIQGAIFTILCLKGYLIVSTRYVFNSFYWGVGNYPFYHLAFAIWISIAILTHTELITYYKKCYPKEKKQILSLMWAMVGYLGGSQNFLVTMGFDVYPYGNFLVPIVGFTISYAIVKHQLLDIAIVYRKSAVYSVLITFISIIYLLIVLLLEKFAQGLLGYRSLIISIFTAFGLGLLFFPLRHRIQQFVDRYFFKGTQQEIVLQNEQLRQEIAQSDKYKTLSTLASGIAHEIKNPLTAMKTFCEYLPRKLDDREFLLKFSRLVGKEVERIDGMVHELLDYSKPAPLALKKTDINKLIQDTLNTLNSQFIKDHIEVVVSKSQGHPSPGNALLNIDANRVKQVLLNLFLNAIEAMPCGGKLTVSSFVDRTSYIVTIADTGSGIAPDDLKHIFDPFFSRKDHGTGLGLAIVQGIMEQHRGEVRITSQVGVGTEVRLEFPLEHEI